MQDDELRRLFDKDEPSTPIEREIMRRGGAINAVLVLLAQSEPLAEKLAGRTNIGGAIVDMADEIYDYVYGEEETSTDASKPITTE